MEHHAQSVGDALIGGLNYKPKAGASYVTNRSSVSYFAQGGNQYSPNGAKVMKFNLTGDQWLDPSTSRVMFQLNNAGNIGAPEGPPLKQIEPLSWDLQFSFAGRGLFAEELLLKISVFLTGCR